MPPTFLRKIVDRSTLIRTVQRARAEGRSIVQCHGCFDIVHPGHIRYLEFARRQGDLLVVSLTGDSNVSKADQSPYIPQELRAESLAALECVDWVHIDPHPTAEEILSDVKPDVYVKGREYERSSEPRFLRERQVVENNNGRVIFSSGEIVFSSTKLLDAVPKDSNFEYHRLQIICNRHGITADSLTESIGRFNGLRVLVVGDVVLDRYVFCDAVDVASEAPVLSLKQLDERRYVGGAAIVARHVAACGAEAFLLSAAANDPQTAFVEEVLDAEGVRFQLLRCRPKLVEKTRFLVDDTKLLKVECGERVPLDSLAERHAVDILQEQARTADAVIFCDFGFGMLTGAFLQRVLGGLRRDVRTITGDVSGARANLLDFHHADLLCPTEREMRSNVHDYDGGLSSVAYQLMQETQARHLIVTLEKKGLVSFERPADDPQSPDWSARLLSEHLPTFAENPVDRLGGGDALLAVASMTLATGAPLLHAAYLGSVAAALELKHVGNIPIDVDALCQSVLARSELASVDLEPALT